MLSNQNNTNIPIQQPQNNYVPNIQSSIPNNTINQSIQGSANIVLNYAGFGSRLVAILIDGLIVFILSVIVTIIGIMVAGKGLSGVIATVSQIGFFILYFVFYQASSGQTLGKKIIKIKVVNDKGNTPSIIVFFLREVIGKNISALFLGIGYLMVLWDGKKQALHDKIAGTYVIKV